MAETIHELAISLSLTAPTLATAARQAIGSLAGIKSAAVATESSVAALGAQMALMSPAAAAFSGLTNQHAVALTAAAAAQDRLTQATKGYHKLMLGGALTIGGIMGVSVIKGWIKDASEMQDALAKVALASVGTQAQLAGLQNQAYTVAGQTQFSAPQIMAMEAQMGRMGINRRDWIKEDIPTIARAAEIDYRMAGISTETSVPAMISQAHMLGALHGKAFIDNIALGTRALLASGMTPEEQNTSLKYLLPVKNATGMSNADMFQWASLSNLMGLSQGKGGSYLGALFQNLVPGVGSVRHRAALADLDRFGGGHIYENGDLVSSARVQQIISKALAAQPNDTARQKLAFNAFGVQGERAAFALTSPAAMASSAMLRAKLAPYDPIKNPTGIATVEQMQIKLNETLVGQMTTLNTNMHSLGSMLGTELIPNVTKLTHVLVEITGGLMEFGKAHPLITQVVADVALAATAISLVAGPLLILNGAAQVLGGSLVGLIKGAKLIGPALELLGPALAVAGTSIAEAVAGTVAVLAGIGLGPLLLIGAAIAGTIIVITHWGQTVKIVGGLFSALGTGLHGMITWMQDHIPGFKGITDQGKTPDNSDKLPDTGPSYRVPNTRGGMDTAGPGLTSIYAAASKAYGIPLNVLLAQGARESDFHNVAQKGGAGLGLAQWDFSNAANAANAMHYLGATSVAQAKQLAMNPHIAVMAQGRYDADLQRRYGADWMSHYNGSGPAATAYGKAVMDASRGVTTITVNVPIQHTGTPSHKDPVLVEHIKTAVHQAVKTAVTAVHTDVRNYTEHGTLGGNSLTLSRHHPG